jgi:ketosteroid isomerase-like protein
MRPKDIVGAWVDAFNRADAEALAAFYEDNAINHQVAEEPVEGREAIREMFANGFARTAMVCIIENVFLLPVVAAHAAAYARQPASLS